MDEAMNQERKKDILHRAALVVRTIADHGCVPYLEDGAPTPAREVLLETVADLDRLAANAAADSARTLHEVVGRIFFKYWDRLSDPVPEDSLEHITKELLQHLEREAMPLMRRPWEKDPEQDPEKVPEKVPEKDPAGNGPLPGNPGDQDSD